jgi:hypothetical protein
VEKETLEIGGNANVHGRGVGFLCFTVDIVLAG